MTALENVNQQIVNRIAGSYSSAVATKTLKMEIKPPLRH